MEKVRDITRRAAVLRGSLIVGTVIGDAPEWSLWSVGSAVWCAAAGVTLGLARIPAFVRRAGLGRLLA
jgi:hypothetical protein